MEIIFELQMFLMATVPLATALAFKRRAGTVQRWIAGTFVAWMFLRTFWSGTRSPLIPIILSLGAAIYFHTSGRWRRVPAIAGLPIPLVGGTCWPVVVVAVRRPV